MDGGESGTRQFGRGGAGPGRLDTGVVLEPSPVYTSCPMKHRRSWLWLALAGLAFSGAGLLQGPLLEERERYHLTEAPPLENAPPLVAFTTVAFGGFRGILADLLWLRATRLQDEGRYFELVQLATWITRLEPRFTEAWAYHAWNMAYNISALFEEPADRWRWVRNGIHLLRDEGLAANPEHPRLCRELAWIFYHKIGAPMDTAQRYFQQAWALEMMALFDGRRPDPTLLGSDARRRLVEEYRLDPEAIRQVDAAYGPFDWRLPQAHAVYWAWRALPRAKGFEAEAIRGLIQSAQLDAFRHGRLIHDPEAGIFLAAPQLDLLPVARKFMDDVLAAHPDDVELQEAFRTSRAEIIQILFSNHRVTEAENMFRSLKERFPETLRGESLEDYLFNLQSLQLQDHTPGPWDILLDKLAYQAGLWRALGEEDPAAGTEALFQLFAERAGVSAPDSIRQRALDRLRADLPPSRARQRLEESRRDSNRSVSQAGSQRPIPMPTRAVRVTG